ncbi:MULTISPECIES: extracellular solute-binding protein [unclassified Bradyrhizobium]|uniref:extracellular solute-binding protein n=1 Tax=unclassified Bradyrhizobium TaxID=2631580 RepID=UPI001CD2B2A0|nr:MULTISPECIES: extracellular solute-binding protein [unclassified Bradyrhizobium]MCA1376418.1 extracellular solute-binding protein [Bradyrhizobium sp. IC4060]MCA1487185.1 extracellular solute-binding protein [Bradyrhizobium sp. IC4061]MCA1542978.1 extracellular solute-binding protein [Bradyrhizobium sp. NBAIM32]
MLGMKRWRLSVSVLASALCIAMGTGPAQAQSNVVIMQDPGGGYGDALRKVMYDPFEKATGIKVVTVQEARSGPRIKAQAEAGKAQWDLTFIFDQETKLLGDCCLADIDYSKLSDAAKQTLAAMPDNLKRKKGVALQVIGVGLVYNKDKYKGENVPTSWADFWDVKKFPGRRCMPAWPRFVFEAALMADGLEKSKLYPIDMERALKKVKEIKPHIAKWWTTSAQPPQLLLDGEADMCMAYTGSMSKLALEGAPIELTFNQGFIYYDFFSIPKGAPNYDNALKLLSWRLEPKRAAQLTSTFPVALPSQVVFEAATDKKLARYWANNPDNVSKAIEWSPDYWGATSPAGNSTNEEYGQEKLNALLAQ